MRCHFFAVAMLPLVLPATAFADSPELLKQEPNTWVKRSPLKDGPPSPGMGYETSLGYDPIRKRVIRWGGHNQGGGGEQNAETWVLDPADMKWELKQPNRSPPGVCCAQQNLFDPIGGRFLRFPAFSGQHGWHWFRENYLNNSSVWSYDLAGNRWRDMRPVPAPHPAPLRCASWDSHHQVAVVFGGEGGGDATHVYDPFTNTWTRIKTKTQPAPRSGGNMAYDAARRLHILFGTQFGDDPHTWAFDLAKEAWRDLKPAVQPPTDRNDPVLAYDAANKVVIALVRVIDQEEGKEIAKAHLETWAYDAGKNTWKALKPAREPDGWGNRRRVMVAIPDQQMMLMEAYVNPTERVKDVDREQQIWTYRYGEPIAALPLPAPTDLVVKLSKNADGEAMLTWKVDEEADIRATRIYRGEGDVPWKVAFKPIATVAAAEKPWFKDEKLAKGKIYHYFARAVGKDDKESDDSNRARTQPAIVEDVLISTYTPKFIGLMWWPPRGDPVVSYNIERAVVEVFSEDEILRLKKDTAPLDAPSVGAIRAIGPFVRIASNQIDGTFGDREIDLNKPAKIKGEPLLGHRFRDDQLDPKGKPYRYMVYAYRIRAVNALCVESGPSPYFLTIPSAVESLFAKEEVEKCYLKWAANPETSIKGYRVYRMESPRINGPGQKVTRLTDDLLKDITWIDKAATMDTKRYWVIAVDALGQEGFPSAPVWHYRQYRKDYEPFLQGPWHQ